MYNSSVNNTMQTNRENESSVDCEAQNAAPERENVQMIRSWVEPRQACATPTRHVTRILGCDWLKDGTRAHVLKGDW